MYRLYESRAKGGPLDGTKLAACITWNGRVVKHRTEGHVYYHQGYYAWNVYADCWQWYGQSVKTEYGRGGPSLNRVTKNQKNKAS